MGYARLSRDHSDVGEHETVYVDRDYERLRVAAGLGDDRTLRSVIASGSALETLGGLAAIAIGIAGLATRPLAMTGAAVIAVGVALFAQGAAVMSRWADAVSRFEARTTPRTPRGPTPELKGGLSTEVFAGIAGIILGTVALAGVRPLLLLPVAVVVYGAALLLGGATQPDLVFLAPERDPRYARVSFNAIQTSGSIMVLVGVAAAVLGILGILDVGPVLTLSLVALIAVGGSLVFAGGALTARLAHRVTTSR